jgi:hypothetical protein
MHLDGGGSVATKRSKAEWTFPGTIIFDNIYAWLLDLQQKKGFAQDMHGILLILDRAAYAQIPWLCEQDCVSKRRERAGEKSWSTNHHQKMRP